MNRSLAPLAFALCAALAAPRSEACATCGCVVESAAQPLGLASGLSAVRSGDLLSFGVDHQQRWLSVNPTPDLQLHTYEDRSVLSVSGQLASRFGLQAQLPVVYRSARETSLAPMQRAGLGNLEVDAWAAPLLLRAGDWEHRLALLAGLEVPSNVGTTMPDANNTLQHALSLGSAAFSGVLGALYTAARPRFALTAGVTARVALNAPGGLRDGHALAASVLPVYRPFEALGFGLGVDLRWSAAQTEGGAEVGNTGGALLALSPTVSFTPTPWLAARVAVQVPAGAWLAGTQRVGPTVLVGLALTWERPAPPPPPRAVLARR